MSGAAIAPPPAHAADLVALSIINALRGHRFDLSLEARTQGDIETALLPVFPDLLREHRLNAQDRPDFMIRGIAIEVKLRGAQPRAVLRQLARYADDDRVLGVILATNRAMGLPAAIGGKPAYLFPLGRAWL